MKNNSVAMAMNSPMSYLTLAFFLSPLFSTSHGVTADLTQINIPHSQTHQNCSISDNFLECEIQQMKFKVSRLGSYSPSWSLIYYFALQHVVAFDWFLEFMFEFLVLFDDLLIIYDRDLWGFYYAFWLTKFENFREVDFV